VSEPFTSHLLGGSYHDPSLTATTPFQALRCPALANAAQPRASSRPIVFISESKCRAPGRSPTWVFQRLLAAGREVVM